jgi:hypothetical protein
MEQLHKNGFIILKNSLDSDKCLECSQEGELIDNRKIKEFIDKTYIPTLTRYLPEFQSPRHGKFRFSNKNNSSDASTFHGDIYNHTDEPILPIYTCLCYFDDAEMEIIPGSHIKNNLTCLQQFNNRQVIKIKKNDMLIFHANIHHRGVNYGKRHHRRILQIFEVFPTQENYEKRVPKLKIVSLHSNQIMKKLTQISQRVSNNEKFMNAIVYYHYFLTFHDLQYRFLVPQSIKKDSYVGYEPGERIHLDQLPPKVKNNINVICDRNIQIVVPPQGKVLKILLILVIFFILFKCFHKWR